MADKPETGVIKDPTKKKFWTSRNIAGLFILAVMPLAASKVMDFFSSHSKLIDRVEALETEQANNKAIWTAITDQKNRMAEIEIDHKAAMHAWEKEYKKSTTDNLIEKYLDRQFGPKPLELPPVLLPPPPKTEPPPKVQQAPIPPEQFRQLYEQQYPVKKK